MDPIGDMFTRIRNGQMRLLTKVEMPSSTFRLKVLEVLKNEGFILSFIFTDLANNAIQPRLFPQYCSFLNCHG